LNKRYLWIPVLALVPLLWTLTPARLAYVPGTVLTPFPEATLIPGTEERIVPATSPSQWVVVFLHGFSATRQETAPLAERVAAGLGASLVEARLAGHGQAENPMQGVLAEHWMADAERVLTRAAEMGDKLVVIGSSTGATLAAAMLDQPIAAEIHTLVMLAPNFLPRGAGAAWLTRPGGPLLAWLIAGETRCWEPANELQARFWSTCYPTAATVEVMRLVNRANELVSGEHEQNLLVFYSPDDQVVSPDAVLAAYNAFQAPNKLLVEVQDSGDAKDHILAGDIMSPGTTARIATQIVEFIRPPAP
jgi:alpha-beta hydrolase superfamily lysophospholipase